jgi:hypothetical protein
MTFYLDGFMAAARIQEIRIGHPERVIHLVPHRRLLNHISDLYLDAFVPAIYQEHIRKAIQLDGASLRADAEFKMARKIGEYVFGPDGKDKLTFPYKCCVACRGVRGLYPQVLPPQTSFETGVAHMEYFQEIFQVRKALRADEPTQGRPDFFTFDNGPACQLFALAVAGEFWPWLIYGADAPPTPCPATSRTHASGRTPLMLLLIHRAVAGISRSC